MADEPAVHLSSKELAHSAHEAIARSRELCKETRFVVGRAIEIRRHSIIIVMTLLGRPPATHIVLWDEDHDCHGTAFWMPSSG